MRVVYVGKDNNSAFLISDQLRDNIGREPDWTGYTNTVDAYTLVVNGCVDAIIADTNSDGWSVEKFFNKVKNVNGIPLRIAITRTNKEYGMQDRGVAHSTQTCDNPSRQLIIASELADFWEKRKLGIFYIGNGSGLSQRIMQGLETRQVDYSIDFEDNTKRSFDKILNGSVDAVVVETDVQGWLPEKFFKKIREARKWSPLLIGISKTDFERQKCCPYSNGAYIRFEVGVEDMVAADLALRWMYIKGDESNVS